jgi:uncharacterized protein
VSRALDVNILLYASDGGSEHHRVAADFLSAIASDGEIVYLAWVTVMGYLRMATHPRIFRNPLSPSEAQANIQSLLAVPTVRCVGEADGFWETYVEVAAGTPVRANLVPDAHLAAILKQHGIRTLYTHDRDFLKFPFLRVIDPLTA